MAMERRITSLEEFSVIAVQAMQEFDAAILRLEAANRETRAAVERSHASVQRLMEFIPVIQAEVVRLDSRIDGIGEP